MVVVKDTKDIDWGKWLYYDQESPTYLRWKVDRFRGRKLAQKIISAGDIAGSNNQMESNGNGGYSSVTLNGKTYSIHRVIWELFNGALLTSDFIDHIDGNRGNNSIENLRVVDRKTNGQNRRKNSNSQTGVTGVLYNDKGRWGDYYVAIWIDTDGSRKSKHFSIRKLGKDIAFEKACQKRKEAIDMLVKMGAAYTERHGM